MKRSSPARAPATRPGAAAGLLLAGLLLAGCSDEPPPGAPPPAAPESAAAPTAPAATPAAAAGPTALQLEFVEQQRGDSEPGPVRMLVTAGHLRIDDGNGADGYILFDRGTRTLYSVSVEDATVIVIEPVAADPEPPLPLLLEERRVEQLEAPTIGGRQPAQVDFLANGQVCYSAAVVPGLLPEAQAAEREYLEALAGEQRAHVGKLPQQLWDPCDLSRYLFAPVRHLAAGYPVQLWDASGYRRGLVGFEVGAAVDPALFELPAGYEQIRMEERR